MSESPSPRTSFDRRSLILPAVLFARALLIRLPGLTWGLKDDQHNQSLHPDEELNFRVSRLIEPAHLSFTPGFYNYGTLYLTALRVAGDFAFAYSGGSDHPDVDWDYIRKGELAGRVVSVIAGCLLCVVVFYTARRFTTDVGAMAAGAGLAAAPALVVHSRFATVDVFATLFIALASLYAIRLLLDENPPWLKCAILAGVCAGLSAGTKYTGGLAVLMPLAAIALRRPSKSLALAVVSMLSATTAFIVSTPGCLLDTQKFMHDFKFEQAHAATGQGMVFTDTSVGFVYHLSNLFLGLGTILTVLGLGGLIWSALRKERWLWVLLAFAIPYYGLIGLAQVKFMRYVFPITVPIAAGVGYAIGEGHRRGGGYGALVALGIFGLGGIDGGGLRGTWFFTQAMTSPDNRELAARYIKARSTDSTVAGLVGDPWFWSPTLYPDITMGHFISQSIRTGRMAAAVRPRVVAFDPRLNSVPPPDYVTYSDFATLYVDRVSKLKAVPVEFADDVETYKVVSDFLNAQYEPVAQFGPGIDIVEDMRYVMPTVYVWIRKP